MEKKQDLKNGLIGIIAIALFIFIILSYLGIFGIITKWVVISVFIISTLFILIKCVFIRR